MDEKSRYERFNEITFEAYCKAAINNAVLKVRQCRAQREKREVLLSDLPENALYDVGAEDGELELAEIERHVFHVRGVDVAVSDERLARAISYLLPKDREIVLLSYFAELTDGEVAQRVKLSRPTVQRRKNAALGKLRNLLEQDG